MESRLKWLLLLQEMELATWIQSLEKAVCISLCANILGEGMNLTSLPPTMGK